MQLVTAKDPHDIPERPPLSLAVGDVVEVGRRDTDWPAFVFVTGKAGSGWVPSRHLSADGGEAVVIHAYDTRELTTVRGQTLEVVERDDESGWLWCRSGDGSEGWVPARTLDELGPGESECVDSPPAREPDPPPVGPG